jgi:hypothetical protein
VAICGAGGRPTSRVDHDVKPISFFLKRQMIKKPYMLYADRHIEDGIVEYIKNRSYYHSIIWEKYKSASEKTLPLIEKAISYVDNWIENIYQNKLPKKEDKK